MNLRLQLILRIVLAAGLCAVLVSAYVLWQAEREARSRAAATADRLARQLSLQLVRISTGTDLPERFPDWSVFEPSHLVGLCAAVHDLDGGVRKSTCIGAEAGTRDLPVWFAAVYRRLFDPGREVVRPLYLNNRLESTVVVSPLAEQQMAAAWRAVRELFGLTAVTLVAVSLMTYIGLARLLRPAERMVADLAQLQQGDLAHRLSGYEVLEFRRIGAMVNRLAEHLEQSLTARADLNRKLLGAHEDERRWLTRELHDEIGQGLAGINALAASIRFTAARDCPGLVHEAEQIGHTVEHLMHLVHNVLARLRPPELDALGLGECVQRLVQHWNDRFRGRTSFEFESDGALDSIPPDLTGHLYRIVQEALNNAARHAAAKSVGVRIDASPGANLDANSGAVAGGAVDLTVEDDGAVTATIPRERYGNGLRGIQERVMALGGQFALNVREPSGLSVHVHIPWKATMAAATRG